MEISNEIRKQFNELLINSLNTGQINHLGGHIRGSFDVYEISGFGKTVPLPQRTAAQALLNYFSSDEDIVEMFTVLLKNEGTFYKNRILKIWGRDSFIKLLEKSKWVYDSDLQLFFRDPFYEREINLLKNLKVLDLRKDRDLDLIIKAVSDLAKTLGVKDLDWRVTMRLYDLDRKISELIRKIIELLLVRQRLKATTFELFTCLKELVINASKANYKILFEKYHTKSISVTAANNYEYFLRLFRGEIDEHGNSRLIELARQEDRFINIVFQSTSESIDLWVINNQNISALEKTRLLQKVGIIKSRYKDFDEDLAEGAGMGLDLILNMLKKYTDDPEPLKVIFYPDFVKIGFILKREEIKKSRQSDLQPDTGG